MSFDCVGKIICLGTRHIHRAARFGVCGRSFVWGGEGWGIQTNILLTCTSRPKECQNKCHMGLNSKLSLPYIIYCCIFLQNIWILEIGKVFMGAAKNLIFPLSQMKIIRKWFITIHLEISHYSPLLPWLMSLVIFQPRASGYLCQPPTLDEIKHSDEQMMNWCWWCWCWWWWWWWWTLLSGCMAPDVVVALRLSHQGTWSGKPGRRWILGTRS